MSSPAARMAPSTVTTALPEHLSQAVWCGDAMGHVSNTVIPSGHDVLDAELPGGGWPCQSMTEILLTPSAQVEWRLLSPALAQVVKQGGSVLLIAPPHVPHLPGLSQEGLRDDRLICIDASTPSERLWATEQAIKSGCVSAVLSWLPQVRTEQIRRLHACASQHPGPLFVFRPARARADSSAAPLRVMVGLGPCPHPLHIQIVKRRGPTLDHTLSLPSWPAGLAPLLPVSAHPAPSSSPAIAAHTQSDSHHPSHAALDRLAARVPHTLS